MKITNEFNTENLMEIVSDLSIKEDPILYANIVYGFGRLSKDLNDKEYMKHANEILNNFTLDEILKEAVNRSDYMDLFAFSRTFTSTYKDWNPQDIYSWKFHDRKEHKYSYMKELINKRRDKLEELGLDKFNRSNDKKKHNHFIYWMNKYLNPEHIKSIRLFEEVDTHCRNTLYLCNSYHNSDVYQAIINYILDNNIVPEKDDEVEVPDFVYEYSFRNTRKLKASANEGGMWYLVYLKPEELQDIYKNHINKRKLSYHEKAVWAYINALKCDAAKHRKFYLYFK